MLDQLPDLTDRVWMLWHAHYWDGPLSGYVKVDNETGYWVKMEDEFRYQLFVSAECADCPNKTNRYCCDQHVGRIFLVYKLTPEQEQAFLADHELFREHVGTHTDYYDGEEGPGRRELGAVKPRDQWDAYYKHSHPDKDDLDATQIVGKTTSLWPQRGRRC